jgi:GNAT superfamily N-acetyltransferase
MRITQLQKCHIADVVSLWNRAVDVWREDRVWRRDIGEYTLTGERLLGIMDSGDFLPAGAFAAQESGKLVGFAYGYVDPAPGYKKDSLRAASGRLAGFAVRPDHWRKGIGRMLLQAVETALRQEGETTVDFSGYQIDLDTGPYHFLLACGYRPLAHVFSFRNDLSRFRLDEDIKQLRRKLENERFKFRWYEPSDREEMLEFWSRHCPYRYPGDNWPQDDRFTRILLALKANRIVGFIGSFYVGPQGMPGSFGSPGVAPEFRQRGLGTVLLHLGLDYLKSNGNSYTEYSTHADNPARFMYLRSGAEITYVGSAWFRKELR